MTRDVKRFRDISAGRKLALRKAINHIRRSMDISDAVNGRHLWFSMFTDWVSCDIVSVILPGLF